MSFDSSEIWASSSDEWDFVELSDENGIDTTTISEYWIKQQFGGKYKWTTLEHNGVLFPPEYIKHNVPVIYNGKQIILNKLQEEYATLYAKYLETEYINNKTFNKNFWKDWKETLGKNHEIQDFEGCDFSMIYNHLVEEKEKKQELSSEDKKILKEEKEKQEEKYKWAIVDGEKQPVGNFRMETSGLFIGRGCSKYLGSIKPRITPEDITINIGKEAPIPKLHGDHQWGKIVHDRTTEWLVSWIENVTGKRKYVWLGAHSKFKAESDIKKFDLARRLKKGIGKIRKAIDNELSHPEEVVRQMATALYLIDNLALRVGSEKGDDNDTVGVTSLRVEHIMFHEKNLIELDFLGKDSIRYNNSHEVSDKVYKNLREFTNGKNKNDDLFDKIDSNLVNKYLQSFMKGLTAKVFRTYNASNLFQKELNKIEKKLHDGNITEDDIDELLNAYNDANIKVALLCNHQKKVAKSFNSQIEKIDEKIKTLKNKIAAIRRKQAKRTKKSKNDEERIKRLRNQMNEFKAKKKIKIELKGISTETSKSNYIDPRITVAFVKNHGIPIDKLFSQTLQEKFKWAFTVDENWKF
ncbi:DNA topoisomerase IB [Indivirus ILV1]|uniref:DNA topoisomerase 1 n=1 Tax=Indivirus ILV1 TaxID=1977633 RepID=A0A1V0SCZ7_9VIRU|nr:DNA topoisomerase IB [Indivirus ILV1]